VIGMVIERADFPKPGEGGKSAGLGLLARPVNPYQGQG